MTVGYGRIGSSGQVNNETFSDEFAAIRFMRNRIEQKLGKGYVERSSPGSAGTPPPKAAPPPSASPPRQPSSRTASKTTYKIYGRKGQAPAHTRYQGKVYVAAADTKFKAGDQATVATGNDGRLSVHDTKTGHTQHWYAEALERLVVDLILDELLGFPDDIELV